MQANTHYQHEISPELVLYYSLKLMFMIRAELKEAEREKEIYACFSFCLPVSFAVTRPLFHY